MAKQYRYRSYRDRRRQSRTTMYLFVAIVVVVLGVIFTIKERQREGKAAGLFSFGNSQAEPQTQPDIQPLPIRDSQIDPEQEQVIQVPVATPAAESTPAVGTTAPQTQPSQPQARIQPEATASVTIPVPTVETDPVARAAIEAAIEDTKAGRIIEARDKFNRALKGTLSDDARARVKLYLGQLAEMWLFSNTVYDNDPYVSTYRVQPGDLLQRIGRDYKVPHELIMRINGIKDARLLRAGASIKVVNGPFHCIVDRSDFTLDLYLGKDLFVKSYKVGLGAAKNETPTGLWEVQKGGKLIKPTWTDPDSGKTYIADNPDYPLGSRWIALEGLEGDAKGRTGFAIHGTKEPESIGKRSSRGCIRLFNGEVIELFELLAPVHSRVRIVD